MPKIIIVCYNQYNKNIRFWRKYMKCNKCGHDNISGVNFCNGCGSKIEIIKTKNIVLNKKFLILIPVLIVAGILLYILLAKTSVIKNLGSDKSVYSSSQNIRVKETYGYFYIDKNGQRINNQIYQWASAFMNDYALVSFGKDTENFYIIDKNGEIVKTIKDNDRQFILSAENEVFILGGILYNNKLKALTTDTLNVSVNDYGILKFYDTTSSEYGILDKKGKEILRRTSDFVYQMGEDIGNDKYLKNQYCILNDAYNKIYQVLNCKTGKVIIENNKYNYKRLNKGEFYYNTGVASAIYFLISDDKAILSEKTELNYLYDGLVMYKDKSSNGYAYYNLMSNKEMTRSEWDSKKYPANASSYKDFSEEIGSIFVNGDEVISNADRIYWPNDELSNYIEEKTNKRIFIYQDESGVIHVYDLKAKKNIYTFDKKYDDISLETKFEFPFFRVKNRNGDQEYYNVLTNKNIKLQNSTFDYIDYNSIIVTLKTGETVCINADLKQIYTIKDTDDTRDSTVIPDKSISKTDADSDINISIKFSLTAFSKENPLYFFLIISITALSTIGLMLIFVKAGRNGWKAIIPVYNIYTYLQILALPKIFIVLMFIPGVNFYILYIMSDALAMKFDKGKLFSMFIFLLPPIAFLYLGLSKDQYMPYYEEPNETQDSASEILRRTMTMAPPISVQNSKTEYSSEKTEVLNFDDIITNDPEQTQAPQTLSSNPNTLQNSGFKICAKCGTKIKATEPACFICGSKFE